MANLKRRALLVGLGAALALSATATIADGKRYYFVQNVQGLSESPAEAPFEFDSHTFTNCGQQGRSGPSLEQCEQAYDIWWASDEAHFSVSSGIQQWVVPETSDYRITAVGARGGRTGSTASTGALVSATFSLNQGDTLRLAIGQMGSYSRSRGTASGGGGTFVAKGGEPLLVAGGGGGYDSQSINRTHGRTGESGASGNHGNGGSDGNGGRSGHSNVGAGGGFYSNGGGASRGGSSFQNGARGGRGTLPGGFGGGGGASTDSDSKSGGGGGYSGGGDGGCCNSSYGGGGGSFLSGSETVVEAQVNHGHGYVIVERLE